MKKLKSLEKILLIITVIAVICGMSTAVSATGDLNDLFNNPEPIPEKPVDTQKPVETTDTNRNNNNSNTNSSNTNTNKNTNKNSTTLPKTGVNDTGVWILAGACVIVAIYTYKKVRDYNV